jgi:hypothetical protein
VKLGRGHKSRANHRQKEMATTVPEPGARVSWWTFASSAEITGQPKKVYQTIADG